VNEQNQTDQTSPGVPEKAQEPDHTSDDSEVIEVSPAPEILKEETAELGHSAPPPGPRPGRRRDEPPVLVIEPDSRPMEGVGRGGPVSDNLEAMVQDLLNKVRSAEDQLRKKEQAISHLQNKTMILAQKLLDQEENSHQQGEIQVGPVMGSDPVSQEAMDFFARALDQASSRPAQGAAGGGSQAARDRKGRDEEARRPLPSQGSQRCPHCGHALRPARCLEVQTTICFSCCGIFLDYNAVRQLARLMPWMRHVQKFLNASRESREKKSAQEQW